MSRMQMTVEVIAAVLLLVAGLLLSLPSTRGGTVEAAVLVGAAILTATIVFVRYADVV